MEITTGAKGEPVRMTEKHRRPGAEPWGMTQKGDRGKRQQRKTEQPKMKMNKKGRTIDYKRDFQRKGKSLKTRSRKS